MTINERVKIARKALKLTQIEFGEKVGISQGHLTSIESGKRTVTDKSVIVICATFGINENWLRTGEGEMFTESDSTVVSQLAAEFDLDVYEKAMLTSFLKLDPWQREFIRKWIKDAMREALHDETARKELLSDQETIPAPVGDQERKRSVQAATASAPLAKTPDEMTLDEMKALLELQFSQEKKDVDAS